MEIQRDHLHLEASFRPCLRERTGKKRQPKVRRMLTVPNLQQRLAHQSLGWGQAISPIARRHDGS